MVVAVAALTPDVVTENVAEVCPRGTVTELGAETEELLLARATENPDGPAGLPSVTVPIEVPPP
jgi:hypothetical protein